MWYKEYRDYPPDSSLKKERLDTSKGLTGCEMHEPNGWGEKYHHPDYPRHTGLIATLLNRFFALFDSRQDS